MIGTPAAFRAYAGARGHVIIAAASDADVSPALQRATDYIEYKYISRFMPGYDATSPGVVEAVYEAAISEYARPNFFYSVYTPGERKVLVGVGDSIRWEVVGGGGGGTGAAAPISPIVEDILRRYMAPRVSAVRVV